MSEQRLHLKAPDNWVNDPNGFLYYDGLYHVFYQYFPYGPRWGTMHWGHAVSRDLVSWEHRGVALFPTKKEDQNGCFSGCAVVKDGRMYLIYTGIHHEESDPEDIHESVGDHFTATQMMIDSEDGFHFDNWKDKKVIIPPITDPGIGHTAHTRDPKVWRGKDAWYLIVGSTFEEKEGKVLLYQSQDLQTWKYVCQADKGSQLGWMWECPDYFEVDGQGVLTLSAMGLLKNSEKEKNQAICLLASFDEDSQEMKLSDSWQFMDYGHDLYASQSNLDEAGRRVAMAWMRMPQATKEGWIGMFCSPRVVEIKDGHIYFRMHPNIRNAYAKRIEKVTEAALKGYKASFELEDGEEVNLGGFRIYRKGERLCTDRSAVYPTFEGAYLEAESPEVKDGWQIEALVEEHLVEVFVNDGEYVISSIVYGLGAFITGNTQKRIELLTEAIF